MSAQELATNCLLAAMFLASSSVLTFGVHENLFYYFNTIPGFRAYPAMTAAYVSMHYMYVNKHTHARTDFNVLAIMKVANILEQYFT